MSQEKPTYRELLEQEIGLLSALSLALTTAKAAIASCRIQDLEESTVIQRNLCEQLEAASAKIRRLDLVTTQGEEPSRVAELRERWQKAHARVQQVNKEVQGVLWRSQRTVNALLNAYRMFEGNYAAEALKQTSNRHAAQEQA
ncbi:MAG TPA: hypothetical protein VFI38_16645 [Candidatus Acidoferrum sp.]|nr:hypothetical protein [Candidatus Acidoferrum sp.]